MTLKSQRRKQEGKARKRVLYKMEIIFLILCGTGFLFSYRKGLRDGLQLCNKTDLEPLVRWPKKETKEQKKARQIALNIENYKGNAEGQVKL